MGVTTVTAVTSPPDPLLDELLALAIDVAERAAGLLVDGLAVTRTAIETKTTATDMVTEIDRASEAMIIEAIRAARPGDGVLAEEGGLLESRTGVRWLVDPLDGTTNYLYGHPGFAVSIGAELDGTAVVGVVHDPLHGEVFSAALGRGAFRNGHPIRHSGHTLPATALVATGFAYDPARRRRQAAVLARVIDQVRDVRRMGSASVDLCSVACGRVDAYYERGLAPWDWCAGVLIASEAGATVGRLEGHSADDAGTETLDSVVAAAPGLYESLVALLTAAGAGEA